MDEPRTSNASAPDTASSPAPPDAQQISSDPEPDADDWDVEPGSGKGGSGAAAQGVAPGDGTIDEDEDELDDLKRISEESRSLELSLPWEDVDEELREFLASGDEDDGDDDDDDGDGDDDASVKDSSKFGRREENDRGVADETSSVGRYEAFFTFFFFRRLG
jgi:RNA polymerase II subunit A C-terminal domain phosphatase